MAFTQPCFIRKNTPELRKKLELIGREFDVFTEIGIDHISVGDSLYDSINCDENEKLFLALAALRDDSTIGQYFVCDKSPAIWNYGIPPIGYFLLTNKETAKLIETNGEWHKAISAELIEHFKTK